MNPFVSGVVILANAYVYATDVDQFYLINDTYLIVEKRWTGKLYQRKTFIKASYQ